LDSNGYPDFRTLGEGSRTRGSRAARTWNPLISFLFKPQGKAKAKGKCITMRLSGRKCSSREGGRGRINETTGQVLGGVHEELNKDRVVSRAGKKEGFQ